MKIGVIIAARANSTRLPGKALLPLVGFPMLQFLIKRIKTSKLTHTIILATSDLPQDDALAEIAQKEGIEVYRGSLDDVLHRYVEAAKAYDFDYCLRITGDEPFLDGPTIDYMIEEAQKVGSFDLLDTRDTFAPGLRMEIYPKSLLEKIDLEGNPTDEEREHVTYFIHQKEKTNGYKIIQLPAPEELQLTDSIFLVDTQEDYDIMLHITEGVTDVYMTPQEYIKRYKAY